MAVVKQCENAEQKLAAAYGRLYLFHQFVSIIVSIFTNPTINALKGCGLVDILDCDPYIGIGCRH